MKTMLKVLLLACLAAHVWLAAVLGYKILQVQDFREIEYYSTISKDGFEEVLKIIGND